MKPFLYFRKELYYSFAAEIAAVTNLFYLRSFYQVILLIALHLIACLLMNPIIFPLIFKKYRRHAKKVTFVLISICFLTFFLGYVVLLLLFIYLLASREKEESIKIESFSVDDILIGSVFLKQRVVGEAPLYLLRKPDELKEKDVDLLSAIILDVKNPRLLDNAMSILSSQHDELRLSLFSMLTSLEKSIQERISFLIDKLKEDLPDEDKANILFRLAQNYYELVYYKLVDRELEKPTLQKAEDYLSQAINIKQNAEFLLLMSKIQLAKRAFMPAAGFLSMAVKLNNLHPVRYAPYIAEIYFNNGQYARVVETLTKYAKDLTYSMNLYLVYICEFWMIDDAGSFK